MRGIFALGPAFVSIGQVLRSVPLTQCDLTALSPLSFFSSLQNQTCETAGVTMRRRGASADNRTRTQQRY